MTQAMTIFRKELDANKASLTDVLPVHLPVERLNRTVISCIKGNQRLLECDRNTLWKAVMTAAVFGLEVDGRQSVILPYGKKAQLNIMVSGLISLAHNAGFVIDAQVVRQADEFDYQAGLDPYLKHRPASGQGRGLDNPVIGAYAISWPIGHRQDRVFDHLDLPDIIARRDVSAAWKKDGAKSIWGLDFPAMARKSAVRARCNHLPWQVQKAEELEGRSDRGEVTWAEKNPDDGSVTIEGEVIKEGDAP